MNAVSISELKPGMALAKSVYDFHDVLLLKAGVALTEQNIRLLKSWGISKVWVGGDVASQPVKRDPQREKLIQATIDRYLQDKFAEVLEDPIMVDIMNAAGQLITDRYLRRAPENETD
jgi:hypothetical protein